MININQLNSNNIVQMYYMHVSMMNQYNKYDIVNINNIFKCLFLTDFTFNVGRDS